MRFMKLNNYNNEIYEIISIVRVLFTLVFSYFCVHSIEPTVPEKFYLKPLSCPFPFSLNLNAMLTSFKRHN